MIQGLGALVDERAVILGLAIDHRDSLDAILAERGLASLGLAEVQLQKAAIVRALAPFATAVMLDHAYGSHAISDGACGRAALIMPLEQQGYAQLGDERRTTLMPDFSPERACEFGAAACKLLLPMRPDRRALTDAQLATAATAVQATRAVGLPIILEPLVFRLSDEPAEVYGSRYTDLVVDAVMALAAVGGDLLKLPVPVLDPASNPPVAKAYQGMADACGNVPWVLYGAGMAIHALDHHVAVAGAAGASGFLVGRSIWADLLARDPAVTAAGAATVGRRRLEQLVETAVRHCRSLPAGRSRG